MEFLPPGLKLPRRKADCSHTHIRPEQRLRIAQIPINFVGVLVIEVKWKILQEGLHTTSLFGSLFVYMHLARNYF
jgi:hypothetical protein